jgi:opacity protein-like surface antigen
VKAVVRAAALTGACLGASGATAHADIIVTPFIGKTFAAKMTLAGTSPLPTIARVDQQTWTGGVAAAWLTSSVFGAELEFGYAPRFFKSDQFLVLPGSSNNVTSLTGNLLVTLPLSVTRESLRPYLTAGMGLLHASVDDTANIANVDSNLLGMSFGGGAIGFLNNRAGVRFDLRYTRSAATGVDTTTLLTEPRLGFWRATFGVALRY